MSAHVLFAAVALVAVQEAEGPTVEVPVRVVSVRPDSVFLNVGRDAGLRAGDRLRLLPAGGIEIEGVVLAVAAEQARVALPKNVDAGQVTVGTPGVARVPAERLEEAAAAGEAQHPPWSAPPEEWSTDYPLLAPARPISAAEREVQWRGAVFLGLDQTLSKDLGDRSLLRGGVDLEASNLFGRGGVLALDLEGFVRDSPDADESDERGRLDRLSYAWGGLRDAPLALEVGRFRQRLTPEFGVLDGVEAVWRLDSGDQLGLSLGYLPEPTPEMKTGEDLAVALGWRHTFGGSDALSSGLAYQKSWHEGEEDRDLAIARLDWRPTLATSLHASAWVDLYGSDEVFADPGAELTEAHLNLTTKLAEHTGVSLFAAQLRRPDTLRYEFQPVSVTEALDYDVTRGGLSIWQDLSAATRLSGRVDLWDNEADSGLSGEVRVGVRDAILANGEVWLTLFGAEGKTTDSTGVRAGLTRWLERGWISLTLDSGLYEQVGFADDASELWQHRVRAQFDRDLGADWDLGLWVDQRFGDELDATELGFSLRRRF